jgi:hypothetical protein
MYELVLFCVVPAINSELEDSLYNLNYHSYAYVVFLPTPTSEIPFVQQEIL